MKSATYDASVLQVFADQLYEKARMIVFWTAARYGFWTLFVSGIISAVIAAYTSSKVSSHGQPSGGASALMAIVLILTFVAVVKGIEDGKAKSFNLRLEAQRILCQRQIEL